MAIGDNFDTTPPGYTNRTTSRRSGHGRISQYPGHYTDDNQGHPCNIGCGCKSACRSGTESDPAARCTLPPELTIHITKAGSRTSARQNISSNQSTEIVHLVYTKALGGAGAWRGRKCCQFDANGNELCDPCDVTTDKDGNKTDCSYSGQEGATRNRPIFHPTTGQLIGHSTGPPGGTRRNDLNMPDGDPAGGRCLQDGDTPNQFMACRSYTDANFNNLYGQVNFEQCHNGFCIDGAGNVLGYDKRACCAGGFTWKYPRCLDSSGNPVGGSCAGDALDGSDCSTKSECDCTLAEGCAWVEEFDEWECSAQYKSSGYTWSHSWITDPSSADVNECCGGQIISDKAPSHQPAVSGGGGEGSLEKAKGQLTCITPYKEYILIPGGAPNFQDGCKAVDNPTPEVRNDLGKAGSAGVFTLIIRECNYNDNCLDSPSAQDNSLIGKETVLYIPIDQMINCSDFRLPFDQRTAELGNPAGFYPEDVNWCHDPDENRDGTADINGEGCSRFLYQESGVIRDRTVYENGAHQLYQLNLQAQPFKATESNQLTAKSLDQAIADQAAHYGCVCGAGVDCPDCLMDINHGLAYWFGTDFIGTESACSQARTQIKNIVDAAASSREIWSCHDDCGDPSGYLHYWSGGLEGIIYNWNLVGDSGLYTGRLGYWGATGLYPANTYTPYQPENSTPPISHTLDNCYGSHRGGRSGVVEFASNTSPIVIKSTNHGLVDDDFISVKGVLGNFSANTLTLAEWKAISWQDKLGDGCDGEECPKIFNPPGLCETAPFDTSGLASGSISLPLWVVEIVDKDHFLLKDCNGDYSDGTVDFAPQCETTFTCVDFLASTVGVCPCNTLDNVPDVISSTAVDLLTDEATCKTYGYCQIVSGYPSANGMMTKDDCITLAKKYSLYDGGGTALNPAFPGSCIDGCNASSVAASDYQDCIARTNSGCPPNIWTNPNYHSCVSVVDNVANFDACWSGHDWKPASTADPYKDKVGNWPACPFTGEWTLCDQLDHDTCTIREMAGSRDGTDQYRLGYDHTSKIREDLANGYYVQIDQTEVCPVCCDHYMPKSLTATISSMSSQSLNDRYCQTDCNGNLPPVVATGYKVFPGADEPYHCEPDQNGNYGLGCEDGYKGGTYCCDCVSTPEGAIAGCFDCGKTYRIDSDWIHLDGLPGADKQFITCCSCDCEPGDVKKPSCEKDFPTLDDFFACNGCCGEHDGNQTDCENNGCAYNALDGSCNLKDGCGGTCGNLSCEADDAGGGGECRATYGSCSDITIELACNGASGCNWSETVPGGGYYTCTGNINNDICNTYDDPDDCNDDDYCNFVNFTSNTGTCKCTPCTGFPGSRDLKCEDAFVCGGGEGGNKGGCTDTNSAFCSGGMGLDNPDGQGCGDPGIPGAIADCVMPLREYHDGCPGLGTISFDMEYNGSSWVSDWVAMDDVGKKQCKLANYPDFCNDVFCIKNGKVVIPAGGASCESVGGELKPGCPNKPIVGADCGACREKQFDGYNCGPDADDWPTGQDNHYIRTEMYCGDLEAPEGLVSHAGPPYGGLVSDEQYQGGSMRLNAWITTCKYPSCGPGNTLCPGEGCFGDCSTAQDGSVQLVTTAHIPGVNCGARSPCVGCCAFMPPFCTVTATTEECPTQTTGCGIPCDGSCEDELLTLVECKASGFVKGPKAPMIFNVRFVDHGGEDPTTGKVPGKLIGMTNAPACNWPVGTSVSLGVSDRLIAETGGGSDATPMYGTTTDILALPPNYPQGTVLTQEIPISEYDNNLIEMNVEDVRAFMSYSGALDRHLWRNTNTEPFPYGRSPWPVLHQTEGGDPQALNNLERIGKKMLSGSAASYDPQNKIVNIENVYDGNGVFSHILVTTDRDHDLITGEKIILDRAECYAASCSCPAYDPVSDVGGCRRVGTGTVIIDEDTEEAATSVKNVDQVGCQAMGGTWTPSTNKLISCPKECEVNGWFDEAPCDPNKDNKPCDSPNCRRPPGEQQKVCYGCAGSVDETAIVAGEEEDPITDDLNGSYVVKFISSRSFSIHYEKYLDFDQYGSQVIGYDPTTNNTTGLAANTLNDSDAWNDNVKGTPWGHEIMVGPAVGPFVDKVIDWSGTETAGGARWTRHAGTFNVVLQNFEYVDKPGTACRQGNSQNPVNLAWDLFFENGCCNNRQPPRNFGCEDKCYQGGGPMIIDWVDKDQDRGKAAIHIAVTE